MKKLMALLTSVLLIVAISLNASAAGLDSNKQKILNALKASVSVDGKTVSIPADILNQAENYLLRDDVVITADQASAVVEQINASIQVVKDAGVTSMGALNGAQKTEILNKINKAAEAVDLTVSLDSAKNEIKVMSDGKLVAAVEPALKVTGPNATSIVIAIFVGIALLSACYVVARKGKLLAK